MTRPARAVAIAAVALAVMASAAGASVPRRVLLVVTASGPASSLLERFRSYQQLESVALMTASIGGYNEQQTLLDLTQGARVPRVDYSPQPPPSLSVAPDGRIRDWAAVLRRAGSTTASIEPGLLASRIPGGAGYAAVGRAPGAAAVLAAGRNGRVAAVSLGSSSSLVGRVEGLLAQHALVIADLPGGALGFDELRGLIATRPPGELLLALERPPATAPGALRSPLLLALGADGLAGTRGSLTTASTRIDGLVSVTDLGPTILRWLGQPGPSQFSGQPIVPAAPRSLAWFASFAQRLGVIATRRIPVLLAFLAAWAALIAAALVGRGDARTALRLGGLGALWAPSTALVGAALQPAAAVEIVVVVGGAMALAVATDRLLPWPRSAAAAVGVMLVLYTLDLARGSPLIETSLLGSNPIAGSRFFGVGNELAAVLLVATLAGLAAALPQRPLRRREIALLACSGAGLALLVAWGRLGANVGAVFTIGGGTAIATLLLIPGRTSWRRLLLATLAILVALGVLALLDLATGGGAHFTREVLHAHSLGALVATLGRRLSEAWAALFTGEVLIAVLVCLAAAVLAMRYRERVLAPAGEANAWSACLGGGLGGSLLGSLANDSGPRLLLVGCFMLLCVLGYLWGAPNAGAVAKNEQEPHRFLSGA